MTDQKVKKCTCGNPYPKPRDCVPLFDVFCEICSRQTNWASNKEDAIRKWNSGQCFRTPGSKDLIDETYFKATRLFAGLPNDT